MRIPLQDLAPEWLASGPGRERMGLALLCPHCGGTRLEAWFDNSADGGPSVTSTSGRLLYQREGQDFGSLSVWPPLRHGDALLFVYEGEVTVG